MTGHGRSRERVELTATFVALGATGAVFGPALPALATATGTDVAGASLAVAALFAGLVLAVAGLQLPALHADRRVSSVRRVGALAQAGGLVAVGVAGDVPSLLAAAVVTGVGFGATEAGASALVVARRHGGSDLSRLSAVFALAAIATPAAVAGALTTTGSVLPVLGAIAALHASTALLQHRPPASASGRPPGRPAAVPTAGPLTAGGEADDRSTAPRSRTGGLLAGLLVLYVGAEVLLSTWVADLARGLLAVPASVAALAATAFWTCLAIGRWLGGAWAQRVAAERLLRRLLLTAATALAAGAVLAPLAPPVALVGVALAVVALGPVYALALALAPATSPASLATAPVTSGATTPVTSGATTPVTSGATTPVTSDPTTPVTSGPTTPGVRTAARRIGLGAAGGSVVPAMVAPVVTGAGTVLLVAASLTAAAGLLAHRLTRSR